MLDPKEKYNKIKYVVHKNELFLYDDIIMIRRSLSISENEFLIEISIRKKRMAKKNNFVYIFFNLNYEEICRKYLDLSYSHIATDSDYIYLNDLKSIALMSKKNKEIIHKIEVCTLGAVIPINSNKSFIIQEKESNAIVEYRIIDNEVVRVKELIKKGKVKLISGLDDDFNTLIIQYKNESLLFLQ